MKFSNGSLVSFSRFLVEVKLIIFLFCCSGSSGDSVPITSAYYKSISSLLPASKWESWDKIDSENFDSSWKHARACCMVLVLIQRWRTCGVQSPGCLRRQFTGFDSLSEAHQNVFPEIAFGENLRLNCFVCSKLKTATNLTLSSAYVAVPDQFCWGRG